VIAGNQPIGIGFGLSFVNLADFQSSWSLPFEVRRIGEHEDEIEVAVEQIRRICESEEFVKSLQINAAAQQLRSGKIHHSSKWYQQLGKYSAVTARQQSV
jgi:hypothetical protein